MNKYLLLVLALIMFAVNVSGCGSGGGDASVGSGTTTVQGIAASGKPISSTVYMLSSSSNSALSVKTTTAGEFSIDTTGLQAPFIFKTVDSSNNVLFSYAKGPGNVNLNPLTTMAVAVAASSAGTSLNGLYNNGFTITASQMQSISNAMDTAAKNVAISLDTLLKTFCPAGSDLNTDFMSGSYAVNQQGLDDLFDKVVFTFSTDSVVITRKDNNANIFTAQFSDVMASGNTGTLIQSNIPVPAPLAANTVAGDTILTLGVHGSLPQGKLIKHISFILQLPLGTTVVTPQSMPPTLVNYIAIPAGTAMGSNIYPAPTLTSPYSGTLRVSMSSVAGFSTGDFLNLWYIGANSGWDVSSFKISDAVFYSDIYGGTPLQNLFIVPVKITIP